MTRSATALARGACTGLYWAEQSLDTPAPGPRHEVAAIDRVPVAQQVARLPAPRRGFKDLLPDPGSTRVGRQVAMDQLAASVRNEEEDIQRPKGEGLNGEQVRRPDLWPMVGQEGPPGLTGWASGSALPVPLNRPLAHGNPELEQLTPDPLAPPARVLPGHPRDQFPHFGTQPGAAEPAPGAPAPQQLPGLTMPADDGVRPDEDQMLTPITAEGTEHDPKQLVTGAEARSLPGGPG